MFQSSDIKLHHFGENRAIFPFFQPLMAPKRRKEGSSGIVASLLIVLVVMMETKDPSLDNFHWNNTLILDFTTCIGGNGVFGGLCRLKRPGWRDLLKMLPVDRL